MNAAASITITPVRVADLLAEGERMPVYVHVIDHPDARVLVDTGMTELHPAVADLDPRLHPLSTQNVDLAGIDIVVNTHLHFDHCGGNHLFAGRPIYVQRRELDDARNEDDYTIREWVEAPGVRYVPVDGELELLPGLRLVPAPGHTRGMQVVVVETGGRPVVVGGDVAVWFGELDEPHTEGQLRVRALDPELVWLAHEREPWRPRSVQDITPALSGPPARRSGAASPTTRSATGMSRTALNITLWVLQVLLACFFVMVGYSHALMPFDQVAQQAAWMNDVPRRLSLFIGYAEVAGGLGLIIPAATRIAPWLTPLAALGLATIMILAIPFHVLKGEASVVWMHALIAAPAVFVAWGRWRKAPIAGR